MGCPAELQACPRQSFGKTARRNEHSLSRLRARYAGGGERLPIEHKAPPQEPSASSGRSCRRKPRHVPNPAMPALADSLQSRGRAYERPWPPYQRRCRRAGKRTLSQTPEQGRALRQPEKTARSEAQDRISAAAENK